MDLRPVLVILAVVIILFLTLAFWPQHKEFCGNSTVNDTVCTRNSTVFINNTIEKIVYVPQEKTVYVNVSTQEKAVLEKINLQLQQKLIYCQGFIEDSINFTNCTDYMEFRDNQTKLADQFNNCTQELKDTNYSLGYCQRRLADCHG